MKRPIRFILCADTHLGFDCPVRPRSARRRRGPDFFANFDRILAAAVAREVDFVVHGGDFFFRSRVPEKIVDLAYDRLFAFAGKGIPFFLVPGNHERSVLPGSLLFSLPTIRLFDRPRTFRLDLHGERVALSGFPCLRDDIRGGFGGALAETGWDGEDATVRLLCMHQSVEGATVGPSDFTFRGGKDVLPMKALPTAFHAVLCGHIHRRQVLHGPARADGRRLPVVYPGSIERTSFAERSEEKGFYEIAVGPSEVGGRRVRELSFVTLPARPMVDIRLKAGLTAAGMKAFLRSEASRLPVDAIVRFRADRDVSPAARAAMTAALLKEILPPTVNYQFASAFFGNPGRDSR